MSTRASRPIAGLVFLILLALTGTAQAWVETAVRSHEARVEVARDGTAVVRHQLVLKVRGGPMKSLEIGGMGTDIEPLPDASVRRAENGSAGMWPLLVSSLEDGSLRLGIGAERGIRGGSYLFSFAYSLSLRDQGWIVPEEDGVLVSWVGPRLTSGVDSAKVTFVIPRGTNPPQLASPDSGAGAAVLLGEVRRGAEFDEVELVRAHLATGEPALWRIVASSDALAGEAPRDLAAQTVPQLNGDRAKLSAGLSRSFQRHLALALILGAGLAVLVFLKARSVGESAKLRDAKIKPLVPGPPVWRAGFSGALLAGAAWFALEQQPWGSVLLGSLALALVTFLLPIRIVRPRGPGQWEKIEPSAAPSPERLPADWFETRRLRGFLLFAGLMAVIVATAYRLLPLSNYLALMTMGLAAPLIPLFWTGRRRDFPQSPLEQAKPWLGYLSRALDDRTARVELWGRRTAQAAGRSPLTHHDEARLRIVLTGSPSGLRAFEISLEEAAGACVLPCVILRVLSDSPTASRLPSSIKWQRGRSPEERVALLRPPAPTRAQLLRLVRTLVGTLRAVEHDAAKRSGRSSASHSEKTSNSGTPLAAAAM